MRHRPRTVEVPDVSASAHACIEEGTAQPLAKYVSGSEPLAVAEEVAGTAEPASHSKEVTGTAEPASHAKEVAAPAVSYATPAAPALSATAPAHSSAKDDACSAPAS